MSANSPNPLVPQGSLQQQTGKAKANVRLAVFSIVAVHAVLIVGVLMQGGCKKDEPKPSEVTSGQPAVPADPYYSDPAQLTPTNPGVASTPADPLGSPFGEPVPAVPTTPIGPTPTTPATNPLPPATTVVDPTLPPVGVPAVPTMAEPAPSVQQYKIQKGDNFYTIAKKLGTTTKKIIEANPNVDPARLQIGQMINVPVSASSPATANVTAPSAGAPASSGTTSTISYEVKPGDTLYGIAKNHGTTVKAIQAASGLKTTQIRPKQILKVPSKASAATPTADPIITAPASAAPLAPSIPVIPGTNNQ